MPLPKTLREIYLRSTDFTHGCQGKDKKLAAFYKVWSYDYDFSVAIDPAFRREMKTMVSLTVRPGDTAINIGCGTGIGTFYAAEIAEKVIGIDLSADMVRKLKKKIRRRKVVNIEIIIGKFPKALPLHLRCNSIISSFAVVHFRPEDRKKVYRQMGDLLLSGGRLGLFSARGEVASSFETKAEVLRNLASAGFANIQIQDVFDIYRIVTAETQ